MFSRFHALMGAKSPLRRQPSTSTLSLGYMKKAKAKNMKIVAVSMEADARAPKLPTNGNERIIDLVCPQSDWIISLKANNADDRFTKISQQYGSPLTIIDKPMDLVQAAPKIFIKK